MRTGQILDLCIRASTEAWGGGHTVSDAELKTRPGQGRQGQWISGVLIVLGSREVSSSETG